MIAARLALLCLVPLTLSAAQNADTPQYVVRGRQTEVRQRDYHDRMKRVREAIAGELRRGAPDLLPRLEPTPPKAYGYGLLPRIVPDSPPKPPAKPEVVRFSWVWSDTLIGRENAQLAMLEADIENIRASRNPTERAKYEALVAGYKARVDRQRPIDSDIDYNWLWQKRIAESRPVFDRLQARLDAEVQRLARHEAPGESARKLTIEFDPPAFVRIEEGPRHEHVVRVPIYTDITDTSFVEAFVSAVEKLWLARASANEYRVKLTVTTIPPERLYCGGTAPPPQTGPPCASPALGEQIDLAAHTRRFPEDGAVLTTGAASLQLSGGRALVLGPHDVSPRTLGHEFGHLLGLPDTYLRGYEDLGADGFQVLELVADYTDIMSSIGSGSVLASHFQGLIAATEIQGEMLAGLTALYQDREAATAAVKFRAVLERNPDHFGATFQLAKALDQAGKPDEAVLVWKKVLAMAEAVRNTETAAAARARLAAR